MGGRSPIGARGNAAHGSRREFIASYNEAVATKIKPRAATMLAAVRAYEASQQFCVLRERTREAYLGKLRLIETKFGSFPPAAPTDRRARGVFEA